MRWWHEVWSRTSNLLANGSGRWKIWNGQEEKGDGDWHLVKIPSRLWFFLGTDYPSHKKMHVWLQLSLIATPYTTCKHISTTVAIREIFLTKFFNSQQTFLSKNIRCLWTVIHLHQDHQDHLDHLDRQDQTKHRHRKFRTIAYKWETHQVKLFHQVLHFSADSKGLKMKN
jgi:hypothetical protein